MGNGVINSTMVAEAGRQGHDCPGSVLKGRSGHAPPRLQSPPVEVVAPVSRDPTGPLCSSFPSGHPQPPMARLVPASRLQHYPGLLAHQPQQAAPDPSRPTMMLPCPPDRHLVPALAPSSSRKPVVTTCPSARLASILPGAVSIPCKLPRSDHLDPSASVCLPC